MERRRDRPPLLPRTFGRDMALLGAIMGLILLLLWLDELGAFL